MNHGTCMHFNGIQNDRCERGVAYEVNWPDSPKPCVQWIGKSARGGTYLKPGDAPVERKPFPGADKAKPCPLREEPTAEQVDQDRRTTEDHLAKTMAGIRIAAAWRITPKPAQDRAEVVECPACKGHLHLSQSAYNGHVQGRCETDGCVHWME